MTLLELSQLLRHQEHLLFFATNDKDRKYHRGIISMFTNKMIRMQKR